LDNAKTAKPRNPINERNGLERYRAEKMSSSKMKYTKSPCRQLFLSLLSVISLYFSASNHSMLKTSSIDWMRKKKEEDNNKILSVHGHHRSAWYG